MRDGPALPCPALPCPPHHGQRRLQAQLQEGRDPAHHQDPGEGRHVAGWLRGGEGRGGRGPPCREPPRALPAVTALVLRAGVALRVSRRVAAISPQGLPICRAACPEDSGQQLGPTTGGLQG